MNPQLDGASVVAPVTAPNNAGIGWGRERMAVSTQPLVRASVGRIGVGELSNPYVSTRRAERRAMSARSLMSVPESAVVSAAAYRTPRARAMTNN
jgi:hypothetical protein